MVRKLLKSLLSLSLIAPLSAYALGLGDISLHSALSERLKADIALLSVKPAEADSLSVSLASQQAFDKVGLERPSVLMYLQFEVVEANGEYTIKVTSKEPIGEPFLDFLVAVEWQSGRVLREYTLLLDPPTGHKDAAPSVTAPSSAKPASGMVSTTTPASATQSSGSMAPALTTVSRSSMPSSMSTGMDAGSIVYGPVKANDTLWRIADKLRPDDVTVQQMMVALVKANPYAFFDNNINRLKRGFVLRIDDPSMLTAMNKAEAAREVARQTRAWHDYREKLASRAKQRPAAGTATEAAPGAAMASKSEPKLTLVAPEGKGVDSAAPSGSGEVGDAASEELMLALESSAAQRKENEALKTRLEALEGQLKDMEQIISLKDADLAALQQQLREQGKSVEMPSDQKPADEIVKTDAAAAEAEEAKPESQLVVKPGDEMPADTMPMAEGEAKPESAEDATAGEEKADMAKELAAPAPKPIAKPKPKPRKPVRLPPPPEPTIVDMLMENIVNVVAGLVAILLLVILGVFIKRRRKGGFQESILNGGPSSLMKANDEQGSETSFLSDLAISGMGPGTIQTDEGEVDPLTEADVFMAYGRNQQAEEVLKKAREKSPDRADISAKLLEVYYNSKDTEKFEALAEEAVGSLQGDDEVWNKVLAMGYELCPENVLFEAGAGTEPPAAAPEPATEAATDTVMDIGLDLDELSAEMEGEGGGEMDLDLGLDFSDLDDESASDNAEQGDDFGALDFDAPEAEETSEEAVADFDVDLEAEEVETQAPEETLEEPSTDDSGLDFDLDLGEEESTEESPALDLSTSEEEPADSTDDLSLDFDMGELDTPATEDSSDAGLDMGDLDLGELESALDEVDSSVSADSSDEGGLDLDMDLGDLDDLGGLDDLGDLDGGEADMTTKLDLAQAYVEMGDSEGARSMLEEVVSGGSDEQKQQAQALIDKL